MRVLAIDPGYDRLGVAVIEGDPSLPIVCMSDCVVTKKGLREERLAQVHETLDDLVRTYSPDLVALETLFFGVNKKTVVGVAEARGVVLAAAGVARLPVVECSPQQVKIAVTGHGGSDKGAVARMVPKLVTLPKKKRLDDEFDAIAVGIAALAIGKRLS